MDDYYPLHVQVQATPTKDSVHTYVIMVMYVMAHHWENVRLTRLGRAHNQLVLRVTKDILFHPFIFCFLLSFLPSSLPYILPSFIFSFVPSLLPCFFPSKFLKTCLLIFASFICSCRDYHSFPSPLCFLSFCPILFFALFAYFYSHFSPIFISSLFLLFSVCLFVFNFSFSSVFLF